MMKEGDYIQEILLKEDNYLPPHSQPRQNPYKLYPSNLSFFCYKIMNIHETKQNYQSVFTLQLPTFV